MKKAFFVMGAERSGTHMMTYALHLSGVTEVLQGIRSYNSNYAGLISEFPALVSVQRSLPANGKWANWDYAKMSFEKEGYTVFPIFMMREFNATVCSQLSQKLTLNGVQAEKNIRYAYRIVLDTFQDDFIPVSYEGFCSNSGFRNWLFVDKFGLPITTIEIKDGNEKYYR